jgi:hypothetical protein
MLRLTFSGAKNVLCLLLTSRLVMLTAVVQCTVQSKTAGSPAGLDNACLIMQTERNFANSLERTLLDYGVIVIM